VYKIDHEKYTKLTPEYKYKSVDTQTNKRGSTTTYESQQQNGKN